MQCTNECFNELVVTVVVGLGGHEEGAPPRHLRTPLEVFRRMPQLIRLIYIIFYYFLLVEFEQNNVPKESAVLSLEQR